MSCLLVTYDLNAPGQDYAALHDEIEGLGTTWWHYLDSTSLVATHLKASEASQRLRAKLDQSDRLLVLDVTSDAYAGWLDAEAWEWIKRHL